MTSPDANAATSLTIQTTSLADAGQGQPYTVALSAAGGSGRVTWSITGGSLPTGLGLSANGVITGTPSGTGTYSFTVNAADSTQPTPQSASQNLQLVVHAAAALKISGDTALQAGLGAPLSSPFTASGGVAPYHWTLSGNVPARLAVGSDGTLTGTPTQAGTFQITAHVTDSATPSAHKASLNLTLVVGPQAVLTITTTSLDEPTQGQTYYEPLSATGNVGPMTWTVASGRLPAGLTLFPSGELSGEPTAAGPYSFTVEAADSSTPTPQTTIQAFSFTVGGASPLTVSPNMAQATVGQFYDAFVNANGGVSPYGSWTVASGTLPPGLGLAANGIISGTPTTSGISTFTVHVVDSATPLPSSVTEIVDLVVNPAPPLSVITTSLPDALEGGGYDVLLNATGGNRSYTWSLLSGSLPPGLTLNSRGGIDGTATASGAFTFTAAVTDSGYPDPQTANQQLTITVDPHDALTVSPDALPSATQGDEYGVQIEVSGGVGADTFAVSAGSLPDGLSLDSFDGILLGTPTGTGTSNFTVSVTDSAAPLPSVVTVAETIAVAPGAALVVPEISQVNATQGDFEDVAIYDYPQGGVGPFTFAVASGLPPGLTMDPSGVLYGYVDAVGTFTFTVRVSDSATPTPNVASQSMTVVVAPTAPPLVIDQTPLTQLQESQAYFSTVPASGGVAPYRWSVSAGSLPPGISLSATTGQLSGTPGVPGTFPVTFQVNDSSSPVPQIASWSTQLTVGPPPSPLSIETFYPGVGTAGVYYFATVGEAVGGVEPYSASIVSGALPPGLTLGATGYGQVQVFGYPTAAGSYYATYQVSDAAPSGTETATAGVSITINPSTPPVVSTTNVSLSTGQHANTQLVATAGIAPYTWSLVSGTLPSGLTLASNGNIGGVATAAATATIVVGVTDSALTPATATGTVIISVTQPTSLTIAPTTATPGTAGVFYSTQLQARGGVAPYTWSNTDQLPAGLVLIADGQLVSDQLTSSGALTFQVSATDSAAPVPDVTTATITLVAAAATPLTGFAQLPAATQGQPYSGAIVANGGITNRHYAVTSGSLPPGLVLDANAGSITGEPTAAGPSSFSVTITDSATPTPATTTVTATMTVTAAGPLAIDGLPAPTGTRSQNFDGQFAATGGTAPYTWSVASGALAPGLTLDAVRGELYGTPTSSGSYPFTIEVTDSADPNPTTVSEPITLTITAPAPLSVATTTLDDANQGSNYEQGLLTSAGVGYGGTWSLASGNLPAGVTLDPDGQLRGVPRNSGTFSFTVQVTSNDSSQQANATLSLTVIPAASLTVGSASLTPAIQGVAYTQTLAAIGGVAPYTWSIQHGSLPSGLTLTPDGQISGTPASSAQSTFTVAVTDSEAPFPATATQTLAISIDSAAAFSITTSSLPTANQGVPFDSTLQASGGVGPYTWSVTGSLPAGLTLDAATGELSGEPTVAGTFNLTVQATDSAQPLPVTYVTVLAFTITPAPAPSISPTLPAGTQGQQYNETLSATGGIHPYDWTVASGTLPAGLSLSANGAVSGEPTGTGTSTFTAKVTDSANPAVTSTSIVSISIAPATALAIQPDGAHETPLAQSYSDFLDASGGVAPYTWSITSGSLPPGITLVPAEGLIEGNPTAAGSYSATVAVVDSATPTPATVATTVAITVDVAQPVTISTSQLPGAIVGQSYFGGIQLNSGVYPCTFSVSAGQLPPGLSLATNGQITGTPTTSGKYRFTVSVTDATNSTGSAAETLVVGNQAPLSFNGTTLSDRQGSYYLDTLTATGGVQPYSWSIASGALPTGVTLSSSGELSGTPTSSTTTHAAVKVTDSGNPAGSVVQTVTFVMQAATAMMVQTSLAPVTQGAPVNEYLNVFGGVSPYTWTITGGALPSGLTLSPSGELTGIPQTVGAATITVQVTDSATPTASSATATVAIMVSGAPPLSLISTALPDANDGSGYYAPLSASGGTAPYTWAVTAGALPPGLSLSGGLISGTPTSEGTYNFAIGVTDSATPVPAVRQRPVSIVVAAPIALSIAAFEGMPPATQGTPYDSNAEAEGGVGPYTWSVASGALPTGITLAPFEDGQDLVLDGTPTQSGTFTFSLSLSDSLSPVPDTASETFSIVVNPTPPLQVNAPNLAGLAAGSSFFSLLSAQGGFAPYTWSVMAGALPDGLTLDAFGDLSGVPETAGTFTATIEVTDSSTPIPQTALKAITFNVGAAAPVQISTTSLPDAAQGRFYSAELASTDGTQPTTWSLLSGSLPDGVTLQADGFFFGTPKQAGTFRFVVGVTDSALQPTSASAIESITVDPSTPPQYFGPTTLPVATAGVLYTQYLSSWVTSGTQPYTFAVTSGTLPDGIDMDSTGTLFGVPTQGGTSTFEVTISDSATPTPLSATVTLTLVVNPAPALSITTTTLPTTVVGDDAFIGIDANGGVAPYTWSLTSGQLPDGMSFIDSGDIVGVPTATGTFDINVTVTDSANTPATVSASFVLEVDAPSPFTIASTTLPTPAQGQLYFTDLSTSGGVGIDSWALQSGSLPDGLTLNEFGVISGEATSTATATFTVVANDDASPVPNTATATYTMTPSAASPVVAFTQLPRAQIGVAYGGSIQAQDGVAPYTFQVTTGALPDGLTLNADGTVTGTPTGSPGPSQFGYTVTDSATPTPETTTGTTSLYVAAANGPLGIATSGTLTALLGQPFSLLLAGSGGVTPYGWSIASGTLPTGMSLSPLGELTGTPQNSGTFPVTIQITDSATPTAAVVTGALTVVVPGPPLAILTTSLPNGRGGVAYHTTLAAANGSTPYAWSIASGSLPAGLSLDASTGTISGTPTGSNTTSWLLVQVADQSTPTAQVADAELSLTMDGPALAVTTTTLDEGTVGAQMTDQLQASGGVAPYSWSITSGSLPKGLTLDPDGQLTGAPTTAGTSTFTVQASDGSSPTPQTATQQLSLNVTAPPALAAIIGTVAQGERGVPYYLQVAATGGIAPYTWAVTTGSLPPGVSLSANGAITGAPTASGTFDATLALVDSSTPTPASTTAPIEIVVAPGEITANLVANPSNGKAPLASALVLDLGQADGDALTYSVDFGDGSTQDAQPIAAPYDEVTIAHTYTAAGSMVAQVTVSDPSTGTSLTRSVAITVAPADAVAPQASLTAQPAQGLSPLATALRLTGSDADSQPMTYTLDFGDGSTPVNGSLTNTASNAVVPHTYTTQGSYAATLTVSDGVLQTVEVQHIDVAAPAPLTANAGDDQLVVTDAPVHFDASGSQPSVAIHSYTWDFGDGSSGSGISTDHSYDSPGTYTATLTVASSASTSTSTATITVVSAATASGLQVAVSASGSAVPNAQVQVTEGSGQRVTAYTNTSGIATLLGLPDGNYSVDAYEGGYLPATVAATVTNGAGNAVVALSTGPVAAVTLAVSRLDAAQIQQAGINPSDAANQIVDKFEAHLHFIPTDPDFVATGYTCGSSFCFGSGSTVGSDGNGPTICDPSHQVCAIPSGFVTPQGDPSLEWLIIPGTASFTKEFFDVQMAVTNLAPAGFTLDNGSATLQIPRGMSLAPTTNIQSPTQPMPAIDGQQTATVGWILRGDTEGMYNLEGDYSGVLDPFGAPVTISAVTQTPLHVWGASAVTMIVDADATATPNSPYNVRIGLKNVSDIPVLNPLITMDPPVPADNFIYQPQQPLSFGNDMIQPGGTFYTPYLVLIPQVTGNLDLASSFVSQVGGNSVLASSIVSHPDIDPAGTAPTLTTTPLYHAVGLTWAAVPGATSYQIYTTPDPLTSFGATPAATVDGNTTTALIRNVDPSTGEWFAVSTTVGGVRTMLHPLVMGSANIANTQPQVNVTLSSNGCDNKPVTVSAEITDGFGVQATGWTYQIGSADPVTQQIDPPSSDVTETFVVPASSIPFIGTTLKVSGTDQDGNGPAYQGQLGGCPAVSGINEVPDVANPTLVIKGIGFGAGDVGNIGSNTTSHYLRITDVTKNWQAGGYDPSSGKADPCTSIIGYWSDTEIIVQPQVNRGGISACEADPSDVLLVAIWADGDSSGTATATGTTTVIAPTGSSPTLNTVTPAYGPDTGGTFADPNGTVTVTGTNLANAEAVWFGGNFASPVVSASSGSLKVVPPDVDHDAGVLLEVATPAGYWHQEVVCDYVQHCAGGFYSMGEQAGWSGGGSFGPVTYSGGVDSGGDDDSDAPPAVCSASAKLNLSSSTSGSWQTSGGIYDATDAGLPTAVIASGTLQIPSITTSLKLTSDLSGTCDVPLFALPITALKAGLYLHVDGDTTGTFDFSVTLKNLSANLNGVGWVDGHLVGDASLDCNGTSVTLSNLSALGACVVVTAGVSISGKIKIGPEIELGPDIPHVTATASIGSLIGVGATVGVGTDAGSSAEVCWAPLEIDHDISIGSFDQSGSGVVPGAVDIYGNDPDQCPFDSASAAVGTLTATATGGSGTLSVSEDLTDPAGPPTFDASGKYFSAQAQSDPFTSATITDCDLNGGDTIYWWNGTDWIPVAQASAPTGTPPCISFTVDDTTSPNLSDDLALAYFGVGKASGLAVATATLPGATAGTAYPTTPLTATGGTAPFTWSVQSGSLPDGLTLDASSGVISGTPTVAGTFPFTIGIVDSAAVPDSAAAPLSITVAPADTLTGLSASSGAVVTGDPVSYTATVSSPVTPTGTVSFSDGDAPIASCQSVPLITPAPFTATCTLSYADVGSHSVTATYAGDVSTTGSTSPAVGVQVSTAVAPLAITTASLDGATVGTAYPATTLQASGGIGPFTWSVLSGALPAGLKLDGSSGVLSGTPTAGGTFGVTVAVTDAETAPATTSAVFSIVVAPAATAIGLSANHGSIVTGQSVIYTATVTAPVVPAAAVSFSDGSSPIASCQSVALTTSAPYTAACTVNYPEVGSHSVTAAYAGDADTLGSHSSAAPVTVNAPIVPLTVSTSALPGATVGTAYPSAALTASGGTGPMSWAVTVGALPDGLTLDKDSGAISGTPTTGGTSTFTIAVTDSETIPVTASAQLSIVVTPADTATALSVPSDAVATGDSVTYTATVSSPVTPTGTVSFSDGTTPIATCQTVAPTATTPYTATCAVTYPDPGSHSVTAVYSGDRSTSGSNSPAVVVGVSTPVAPLAVGTPSLADGTVGTAYPSTALAATGGTGPMTWAVTIGALPDGLALDKDSGTISGTPTKQGTFTFTVAVTDSETDPVTATAQLSITVAKATTSTAISVTSSAIIAGQPVTYTATVSSPVTPTGTVVFSDGTTPIASCQSVALTATTPFTAGCTVTYTDIGSHTVTAAYAGDAATIGSNSPTVSVVVNAAIAPLAVLTTSLSAATAGTAYPTTGLTATGGTAPYTWSLMTGSLPTGLKLDSATGVISGTPSAGGTFAFRVEVTDSQASPASAFANLSIKVAPAVTSTALSATANSVVIGTPVTYTATVSSPMTPTGTVSFSDGTTAMTTCQSVALSATAPYTATCTVSYSATGTHSVTATYSGDTSTTGSTSAPVSVAVKAANVLAITSVSHATATAAKAFTFTVTTSGTPVPALAVSKGRGQTGLPAGITFTDRHNGTGVLAGTASRPGTYTFTITASVHGHGSVTQTFTLVVNPAPLTLTTTALLGATVGSPYPHAPLTVSGGAAPYTWLVLSGSLPPGLWLDAAAGVIRGTPTAAGIYHFTIGVTDSETVPASASAALSITVSPAVTVTSVAASKSSIFTGQSVTYTATVSSPVVPRGTVTFTDQGKAISVCEDVTVNPSAPYRAVCTVSYAGAGTHSVSATYSGDPATKASTSPAVTVAVSAAKPITFTSRANATAIVGESLRFTVTTSGQPIPVLTTTTPRGESGLPHGVHFTDDHNGTALLTGTPTAAGTYTFTITATAAGQSVSQLFVLIVTPRCTYSWWFGRRACR